MSLGVTMAQAWDTELPDVWALLRYLHRHPPVHRLVADYLGYKPPDPIDQIAAQAENERAITRVSAEEFDRLVASYDLPPMEMTPNVQ